MRCLSITVLLASSVFITGCNSVRQPDAKATIKIWKSGEEIVTHTTVNGEVYVTVTKMGNLYE